MRRLTEFEKEIVDEIYESNIKGTSFSTLFKSLLKKGYIDDDTLFEITKDETSKKGIFYYSLCLFEPITDAEYAKEQPESELTLQQHLEQFPQLTLQHHIEQTKIKEQKLHQSRKRFFDTLYLIYLLEQNGLLYNENGYASTGRRYLPYLPVELVDYIRGHIRQTHHKGKPNVLFRSATYKEISEKDFNTITNTTIESSEAMEIYIRNGYRTEEQRSHDAQFEFNSQSILVARKAAWYAAIAVAVSALFSALTLIYTFHHDKQRDIIEDERYSREPTNRLKFESNKVKISE